MSETTRSQSMAVEMVDITKTFGGVTALQSVNFAVAEGEIRGLVGENGAGKSTLMKILSGAQADYQGELRVWGEHVQFKSTADASQHGIGMVYQELSVIGCLSVAENNFLGKQPVNRLKIVKWKQMQEEAEAHLKSLGIDVDVNLPLNLLPFSVRQMIEIAKVIFSGAKIIILDEPTSSLSQSETKQLFELVLTLKARGHTIIFISHFIEDVMEISDSITILKDAQVIETLQNTPDLTKHDVINKMIGTTSSHLVREVDEVVTLRSPDTELVLEVDDLTKTGDFEKVSFDLRRGEILGLYGLMGAGHEEVGRAIFGLKKYDHGTVRLENKPVPKGRPYTIKNLGIAYISEDRGGSLFQQFEIFKNISLPYLKHVLGPQLAWLIKLRKEISTANRQIRNFAIKSAGPEAPVGSLSGGNQQKVALAKWLTITPKVIILQEPTRGVDVGAKSEIVQSIRVLKDQGLSCLVISMEPETILDLCDRVLIFSRGTVVTELQNTSASKSQLMELT
ncbi:ATP-binding cassette domain-containing protein [candidate division KSB3 bacterium]|uniref:ATP-binding cassette domain-containing protein n=1 Tax=candidate division KSB3 bacterium TaxID=2044937 RepID=A0A9D5JUD4_9BACT|nr:ATP-binding cassette domain-containing protein [candidate division KSB3 bacterium]MBD3324428.1 ATP-binding cassette domain-containing protein [candidate division KSB3 bacterium]